MLVDSNPLHKGHFKTFQHLQKKFGKGCVHRYIQQNRKRTFTFNFKEKVKIMTTMFGIPKSKIVQVKNPYNPQEVLKRFNKETTAFVTVVGRRMLVDYHTNTFRNMMVNQPKDMKIEDTFM